MNRALFLLNTLACLTFLSTTSVQAAMLSLERSDTIVFKTATNKPFAVDLTAKTKSFGEYSIVNSSSWLQITPQGILFGTPDEKNMGLNKVFVSVKRADSETLFRVDVNVVEDPTSPAFNYSFKVGQIVKLDLAALTGIKGKYAFTGLPAWLEGTEAGVLIGMAEKTDIGQYQIEFVVEGAEKVYKSVVHVEVEGVTAPPPAANAFQAQVGVMASINLRDLATMEGDIQVTHAPGWMTYTDGWLYGTPTKKDVGESWVGFFVLGSHTKTGYTFRTLVTE